MYHPETGLPQGKHVKRAKSTIGTDRFPSCLIWNIFDLLRELSIYLYVINILIHFIYELVKKGFSYSLLLVLLRGLQQEPIL